METKKNIDIEKVIKKKLPTALAGWLIGPGYDFATAVDMVRACAGAIYHTTDIVKGIKRTI